MYIYRVRWVNWLLNNTKMKITLTSHFIKYIKQNYWENILKSHRLNLFLEIAIGSNHSLQTTLESPVSPSNGLLIYVYV